MWVNVVRRTVTMASSVDLLALQGKWCGSNMGGSCRTSLSKHFKMTGVMTADDRLFWQFYNC